MNELKGIVLYNIERDDNLNGVYTNNRTLNSEIFTETARLIKPITFEEETEIQNYQCFYFDAESNRVNCTLTFRITNGLYQATWRLLGEDNPIFIGEGFLMNDRQIAISYWNS